MTRCEIVDVLPFGSDLGAESRYAPHGAPASWDASAGANGRLPETTRRPSGVLSELQEGVPSAMPHLRTFNLGKQSQAPLGTRIHGPNGLIRCERTQRDQEPDYVLPLPLGRLNYRHHRAQTPRPGACTAAKGQLP